MPNPFTEQILKNMVFPADLQVVAVEKKLSIITSM